MKKLSGFLLLFVFLCCSLSAKETQIIIFSTNDMHGSIDNFATGKWSGNCIKRACQEPQHSDFEWGRYVFG